MPAAMQANGLAPEEPARRTVEVDVPLAPAYAIAEAEVLSLRLPGAILLSGVAANASATHAIAPRNASAVFDGDQPPVIEPLGIDRWPDLLELLQEAPAPATGSDGSVTATNPHVPDALVHAPALVR